MALIVTLLHLFLTFLIMNIILQGLLRKGGNEADCLINEPGEIIPPLRQTHDWHLQTFSFKLYLAFFDLFHAGVLYVSLSWAVELVLSLHTSVYNKNYHLPGRKLRKLLLLLMLYIQSVSAALSSAHVWPYSPILCLYVKLCHNIRTVSYTHLTLPTKRIV